MNIGLPWVPHLADELPLISYHQVSAVTLNFSQVKNMFHKDLVLWLRQLKIEFLKYTPNPALRYNLTSSFCPLARWVALLDPRPRLENVWECVFWTN